MTKQETPEVKKENPYLKLDETGIKTELAKFSEALKSDTAKNLDIADILGIKKSETPKDVTTDSTPKPKEPSLDAEQIKRWTPIYENAKDALVEAGFKFEATEPLTSKMSEAEKAVGERITKIATAKFSEQKTDLLKTDKDFPVEIIEKLDIPIEDKVIIMSSMKEVTSRNSEAVAKVQKELDVASKSLDETKILVPKPEEKNDGAKKVAELASKMGAGALKGIPVQATAQSGSEKLAEALKQIQENK